jgi:hypothetical protein
MANKRHIIPYSAEYEQWLAKQGYPHPPRHRDIREPITEDILWALTQFPTLTTKIYGPYLELYSKQGESLLLIEGPDWSDPASKPQYLVMRGLPEWEIRFVTILCQRCRQLAIYPDSGAAGIILDPTIDCAYYTDVWTRSYQQDDAWKFVHETLYA